MNLNIRADDHTPSALLLDRSVARWRVLVVTQDPDLGMAITACLREHQCSATHVVGADVMRHIWSDSFTLIILDAQLKPQNGFDMLLQIRARSDVPLIMVTRKGRDEIDYVIALELGADDFLGQPLNPRELLARGRAILRRHEFACRPRSKTVSGGYRFNGWELRRRTRTLTDPDGNVVDLTKNEYALLTAFLDAPGQKLSRVQLMRATRPHEDIFDRTIDIQVLRLRRKLENRPAIPALIKTERGIGYSLDATVEPLF